jgi:hypothetical protein
MKDLFTARLFVELADKLRVMDPTTSADLLQMTRMAISVRDVSDATKLSISQGINDRDIGELLTAFWGHFIDEVELYPTTSRLLINPPKGLDPRAEFITTVRTQTSLCGSYGFLIDNKIYELFMSEGFFSDVTVFWGAGLDLQFARQLATHRIDVGTTVTFLTPAPVHDFWLTWAQYDSGLKHLIENVSLRFQPVSLHRIEKPNVVIEILGMQPQQLSRDAIPNTASDNKA